MLSLLLYQLESLSVLRAITDNEVRLLRVSWGEPDFKTKLHDDSQTPEPLRCSETYSLLPMRTLFITFIKRITNINITFVRCREGVEVGIDSSEMTLAHESARHTQAHLFSHPRGKVSGRLLTCKIDSYHGPLCTSSLPSHAKL